MSWLWNGEWDGLPDFAAIVVLSIVIAVIRLLIERRWRP